jgi:hypothetical protein
MVLPVRPDGLRHRLWFFEQLTMLPEPFEITTEKSSAAFVEQQFCCGAF